MRTFLRRLISTLLYPFLALGKREGIRVLTYHRVNDTSPADRLSVKTGAFRKQMAYLSRKGYRTLTPEGLERILRGEDPFPRRAVLVTFDDGYRDNDTDAFPILKANGMHATIFVATDFVGKEHDGHPMLTWGQIREMSRKGISFGSHTARHIRMDRTALEENIRETESSKRTLEEKVGTDVISFCYPFGGVGNGAKEAVQAAGYRLAFTTRPGAVRRDSDPFLLPRTEVSGFDSLFDFRKKLAGAFDWLHEIVQLRQERFREWMQPIPVLYVIWSLGLGGAEQVVISLAKGLDRKQFTPLVACLNEAGLFAERLEREGIRVFPLYKKGRFDLSVLPKLIRLMKENRVAIVHTHLSGGNLWGRIAARLARVPVVIATEHSYAGKPKVFYPVDWLLSFLTDRIVVVSEKVKTFYAKRLGVGRKKLHLIYNGIDTAPLRQRTKGKEALFRRNGLRKELGLSEEAPLLGIIGRLTAVKAHEVLIEAVVQLRHRYPDLTVAVVGDGERRKALEEACRARGLERHIRFLGLRKDMEWILSSLDMVVVSSDREGLSVTVLEAMAASLPVVATRVGGTGELVVDQETGFLVPPRQPALLADRIDRLLKDRTLSHRTGEAGWRRVQEHFSSKKMVRETEALYCELLTKRLA